MGRKLILTGTKLTNLSAPKLATIDQILPEAGALLFLDPSHPYQQWGTIDLMSTNGTQLLPNLAYDQAKAMIPTGTTATLGGSYVKGADLLNDGIASKIERTGKGGLYVNFSRTQGNTAAGGRTAMVNAGAAINTYLNANKSHQYYGAYWGMTARGAIAFSAGAPSHSRGSTTNSFFNFYTRPTTSGELVYPTTNPPRLAMMNEGATNSATATNLPLFQDAHLLNGDLATTGISISPFVAQATAGADSLKGASMIFYGYYLEDLTVSGRTYAQVNALVKAKFDKDVKTVGGRYYADTFTAPLA
jgi:hypothetical protein